VEFSDVHKDQTLLLYAKFAATT